MLRMRRGEVQRTLATRAGGPVRRIIQRLSEMPSLVLRNGAFCVCAERRGTRPGRAATIGEEQRVMASNTIPFRNLGQMKRSRSPQRDQAIAERMRRAVAELQSAMDEAVLAGLVVEPGFSRIERRLAGDGVLIESFVCRVDLYRELA